MCCTQLSCFSEESGFVFGIGRKPTTKKSIQYREKDFHRSPKKCKPESNLLNEALPMTYFLHVCAQRVQAYRLSHLEWLLVDHVVGRVKQEAEIGRAFG